MASLSECTNEAELKAFLKAPSIQITAEDVCKFLQGPFAKTLSLKTASRIIVKKISKLETNKRARYLVDELGEYCERIGDIQIQAMELFKFAVRESCPTFALAHLFYLYASFAGTEDYLDPVSAFAEEEFAVFFKIFCTGFDFLTNEGVLITDLEGLDKLTLDWLKGFCEPTPSMFREEDESEDDEDGSDEDDEDDDGNTSSASNESQDD